MNQTMSRRTLMSGLMAGLIAGPSALLTSGCTSPARRFSGAAVGSGYPIDSGPIAAQAPASLGLRIGRGESQLLSLAGENEDGLRWVTENRIAVVTRRGRLVKTAGLSRDLLSTQWSGRDALFGPLQTVPVSTGSRINRFVDLRPNDDFGVAIEARYEPLGAETLSLMGQQRRTVHVLERVFVSKWRWTADNHFWLDEADGRIWKSRQQYCPEVPPLTLELLMPAAEAGPVA